MSEHTKEPWVAEERNDGQFDIYDHKRGELIADLVKNEDASRIVACVNACKGIPDDMVSHVVAFGLQGHNETSAKLIKGREQRDVLLAALNLIEVDGDGDGFICREAMVQVRAAIASADRLIVEATESEGGEV